MILFFKSRIVLTLLSFSILCALNGIAIAQDMTASSVSASSVEDPVYTYSAAGMRDPFAPLVQKESRVGSEKPKRELGPLEKFELSQFRLLAMMIVQGSPRAMVKAPDGKSYTVKVGDMIGPNGGVVTRIETKTAEIDNMTGQRVEKSPDRIVVIESGVDSYTGKVFKEELYIEM